MTISEYSVSHVGLVILEKARALQDEGALYVITYRVGLGQELMDVAVELAKLADYSRGSVPTLAVPSWAKCLRLPWSGQPTTSVFTCNLGNCPMR